MLSFIIKNSAKACLFFIVGGWLYIASCTSEKQVSEWKTYDKSGAFNNGLAVVASNGKFGCVDTLGHIKISLKYDYCSSFEDSIAAVTLNRLSGFINTKGEYIVPLKYDKTFPFVNGVATVIKNDLWGIINRKGKKVIPLKYDYISDVTAGFVTVRNKNFKWGVSDMKGNVIIPLNYSQATIDPDIPAFIMSKERKKAYFDKNGEQRTDFLFNEAFGFSEGLAPVEKNYKWGFLDTNFKIKIPLRYDEVRHFDKGLAAVSKGNQWGYINKKGRIVHAIKYNSLYAIDSLLRIDTRFDYLGDELSEVEDYSILDKYVDISSFVDGYAVVSMKNNKWGVINEKGELVTPEDIGGITFISNGFVQIKMSDGYWYYFKLTNKKILPGIRSIDVFSYSYDLAFNLLP